jgi:hypothetical protein
MFKPLDFVVIALSLVVSVGSVVFATRNTGGKPVLIIESQGEAWMYRMDRNTDIEIPGVLGASTLEIKDGQARFVDSPCANKTCVAHSPLTKVGDWSACLPNQVLIRVEGEADDGLDVVVN